MTQTELDELKKISEELDLAAFQCAGCLAGLVKNGLKHENASKAVERFSVAHAAYERVVAINKMKQGAKT